MPFKSTIMSCPECGKRYRFVKAIAGRKAECACGAVLRMPDDPTGLPALIAPANDDSAKPERPPATAAAKLGKRSGGAIPSVATARAGESAATAKSPSSARSSAGKPSMAAPAVDLAVNSTGNEPVIELADVPPYRQPSRAGQPTTPAPSMPADSTKARIDRVDEASEYDLDLPEDIKPKPGALAGKATKRDLEAKRPAPAPTVMGVSAKREEDEVEFRMTELFGPLILIGAGIGMLMLNVFFLREAVFVAIHGFPSHLADTGGLVLNANGDWLDHEGNLVESAAARNAHYEALKAEQEAIDAKYASYRARLAAEAQGQGYKSPEPERQWDTSQWVDGNGSDASDDESAPGEPETDAVADASPPETDSNEVEENADTPVSEASVTSDSSPSTVPGTATGVAATATSTGRPPLPDGYVPVIVGITPWIHEVLRSLMMLVIFVPCFLVGVVVISSLFGSDLGTVFSVLLKFAAVAIFMIPLGFSIDHALDILTGGFGGMGAYIKIGVVYGAFCAVCAWLFEYDGLEISILFLFVYFVPWVVMILIIMWIGTMFM